MRLETARRRCQDRNKNHYTEKHRRRDWAVCGQDVQCGGTDNTTTNGHTKVKSKESKHDDNNVDDDKHDDDMTAN